MALLFLSDSDDPHAWRAALNALEPALEVRVWPEVGARQEIDVALVWSPPPGELARYPNLKLVQSLGAGVDHVFADPSLPTGVPVARLVDGRLTEQMVEYVLLAVLNHYRRLDAYRRFQAERRWRRFGPADPRACRIGLLGLGVIGQAAARALVRLGFSVAGWSRTPKAIDGVESFHGASAFGPFLARSDVLVCLLPLTPETEGILDATAFAALPAGAYLINAARGAHLVEDDLLAALASGRLSGAWLDVFRTEPLPPDHPFWGHPAVTLTPHVAGLVEPHSAAALVVENLQRVRAGLAPRYLVDPIRRY